MGRWTRLLLLLLLAGLLPPQPIKPLPVQAAALEPAGYRAPTAEIAAAQIGGRLWLDKDRDSKQDGSEPGMAGHTVNLLDQNGATLGLSTTTGANGIYVFGELAPGTYIVEFIVDGTYMDFALADVGTDAIDSDVDPANGRTTAFTLTDGASIDVDAGVLSARGMGDFIWLDQDQDGRQDVGEPGFPGMTVRLLLNNGDQAHDLDGNPYVLLTSDLGGFLFADVLPGRYSIGVDLPGHMQFTAGSAPGVNGAVDSDVDPATGRTPAQPLPSNDLNKNRDGGILPGAVADRVWEDVNGNNLRDDGEPGVAGVVVKLVAVGADNTPNTGDDRTWFQTTTLADGAYAFPAVFPIEYYISFTAPANGAFVTANAGDEAIDSDADPATGFSPPFLVSSLAASSGVSAGFVLSDPPTATPEPATSTPTPTPIAPTPTDTAAPPTVTPTTMASATATGVATATPMMSTTPSPAPTATPTSSNGPVTISGGVYHDGNGNGAQDADEPGIAGVIILLSNGQGTATDGNGGYSFTVLRGEYIITQTDLADYVSTGDADGVNDNQIAVSVIGFPLAELNFYDARPAAIHGVIIHDLNGNGQEDANEPGLAGVRVTLSNGQETITAADGSYFFTVPPGIYTITVTDPSGYQSTGDIQGANDNQITLTVHSGAEVSNQNFFDQAEDSGAIKSVIRLPLTFR
ncbi:MAG: SdrD B-like domain-containing protein [Caldilineaceae bacterium]